MPKRLRNGYDSAALPREAMPRNSPELFVTLARYAIRDKSRMLLTQGLGSQPFHDRIVLLVNEWTNSAAERSRILRARITSQPLSAKGRVVTFLEQRISNSLAAIGSAFPSSGSSLPKGTALREVASIRTSQSHPRVWRLAEMTKWRRPFRSSADCDRQLRGCPMARGHKKDT
jgi:hypothetical protein